MKKLIVFLVLFSLIANGFAGCSLNQETIGEKPNLELESTPSPSSTNKADTEKPKIEIDSNKDAMRIILPKSEVNTFTQDDLDQWEDYIFDKYNFNIDIVLSPSNTNDFGSAYIADIEDKAERGGFIYVESLLQLNSLIDSGLISPVNNYIGQIDEYNVLDDSAKQRFTDFDGNIWGLPLIGKGVPRSNARIYDKGWLELAGMGVPETIEEFLELAMVVANGDLDGNGKNDTYVAEYTEPTLLIELMDIFRAFGCFTFGQSPVAYNPIKNMYENCVFNENFTDAMGFIKLLNDENLLINILPSGGGYLNSSEYQVATVTRYGLEGFDYFYGFGIGNYLTGTNNEKILESLNSGPCFAVLEGTDNAAEIMNDFFNMLKSNPNSYMDFVYGIEGKHYTEDENYFHITTKDSKGNYILNKLAIYIMLPEMGFSEKYVMHNGIDNRAENESIKSQFEIAREEARPIDESVIYTVPLRGYSSELENLRQITYRPTRDLFHSILAGNVPIETAIETYRSKLETLKVFDLIDSMNMDLLTP